MHPTILRKFLYRDICAELMRNAPRVPKKLPIKIRWPAKLGAVPGNKSKRADGHKKAAKETQAGQTGKTKPITAPKTLEFQSASGEKSGKLSPCGCKRKKKRSTQTKPRTIYTKTIDTNLEWKTKTKSYTNHPAAKPAAGGKERA